MNRLSKGGAWLEEGHFQVQAWSLKDMCGLYLLSLLLDGNEVRLCSTTPFCLTSKGQLIMY